MTEHMDEVIFKTAMYWRIAYGVLRLFIGYKLLSLIGVPAVEVYQRYLGRELTDGPHDHFLQFIGHSLSHHSYAITYFLAAYVIFWGAIDIVLSIAMIRHQLWAFTSAVVLMLAFIAYEAYRFTHTHSHILFAFILIDLFFVYLIHHEHRKLIARTRTAAV